MSTLQLAADSKSLIKKHLSPALYEQLCLKKTTTGYNVDAAIASGIKNPDSKIGIYAGDVESYSLFSEVFEPIIHEYHQLEDGFNHDSDLSFIDTSLPELDKGFIVSTRIRVARNIEGYSFTSHLSKEERKSLELLIISATESMVGELNGGYISFEDLTPSEFDNLLQQKLAFTDDDRYLEAAGITRDFPKARGIFFSEDKKTRILVNEEDHLRITSLDTSSDIIGVYNRLIATINHLSNRLDFCFDEKYGFLASCPTNLGTAMRASVHIKLEYLEKNQEILKSLVNKHQLQLRGTMGENTKVESSVFDISNKHRLGISEKQIVENLYTGIAAIIEAEKELSSSL